MWHYGNMWCKWRVRVCLHWTKCAEMLKNAMMRIFATLCINKYSKFWKCHYMRENMRYVHFCKICEMCCDRMIAINRYPYMVLYVLACCSTLYQWTSASTPRWCRPMRQGYRCGPWHIPVMLTSPQSYSSRFSLFSSLHCWPGSSMRTGTQTVSPASGLYRSASAECLLAVVINIISRAEIITYTISSFNYTNSGCGYTKKWKYCTNVLFVT